MVSVGRSSHSNGPVWFHYDEHYEQIHLTLEQELSGIVIIEFSLSPGESGGINNPEYLVTIDAFARWYRQQPKVIHSVRSVC